MAVVRRRAGTVHVVQSNVPKATSVIPKTRRRTYDDIRAGRTQNRRREVAEAAERIFAQCRETGNYKPNYPKIKETLGLTHEITILAMRQLIKEGRLEVRASQRPETVARRRKLAASIAARRGHSKTGKVRRDALLEGLREYYGRFRSPDKILDADLRLLPIAAQQAIVTSSTPTELVASAKGIIEEYARRKRPLTNAQLAKRLGITDGQLIRVMRVLPKETKAVRIIKQKGSTNQRKEADAIIMRGINSAATGRQILDEVRTIFPRYGRQNLSDRVIYLTGHRFTVIKAQNKIISAEVSQLPHTQLDTAIGWLGAQFEGKELSADEDVAGRATVRAILRGSDSALRKAGLSLEDKVLRQRLFGIGKRILHRK